MECTQSRELVNNYLLMVTNVLFQEESAIRHCPSPQSPGLRKTKPLFSLPSSGMSICHSVAMGHAQGRGNRSPELAVGVREVVSFISDPETQATF